ncbi:MAG: hypothetical protein WKG07_04600 [Hymenobacter sp.]
MLSWLGSSRRQSGWRTGAPAGAAERANGTGHAHRAARWTCST